MTYPADFRYTKEHEWVHAEGDIGTAGITDHAQKELGDIVYVDLPKAGVSVEKGKAVITNSFELTGSDDGNDKTFVDEKIEVI